MIDWGHSIFYSKYDSKKNTIVILSPSRLKISDYFLYSIALYFRWKTSFKRKQSQNTKQVEYCKLFETRSIGGERLKTIQKQGDYLG